MELGQTYYPQVKNSARQLARVASDKMRVASSSVSRGETHELDIAIIKATTSQYHVPPKEKHVRTLKAASHPMHSRRQLAYVVEELIKRLKSSTNWLTALKTLVVIHRLLRETDGAFLKETLKYAERHSEGKRIIDMENFIDATNVEGRFEFSDYVRAYGKYLNEQVDVYRQINFYQEQEAGSDASQLRTMGGEQLLVQLPVLQRLLSRLMDCRPVGAAMSDVVVEASLLYVLKESFKVYKAISEGLINLADRFFEMEYLDSSKGLEIYKEQLVASQRLQAYYRDVEQMEGLKRMVHFPKLEPPPADFLVQMEEYCREAPRPIGDPNAGAKKRSPPFRRGRISDRPRTNGPSIQVLQPPSDPGMVLAVTKVADPEPTPAEEQPAQLAAGAAPQVDLLNFEDLALAPPDTAATGAHAQGARPPLPPGPQDFLSGGFSAGSPAFATGAGPGGEATASSNPFGCSAFEAAAQAPAAGFRPAPLSLAETAGANPFGAGGLAAYTPGTGEAGAAAPSPGLPRSTPGGAGPASLGSSNGSAWRLDTGSADPFAELTGLKRPAPRANVPLKSISPASSARPSTLPSPHVPMPSPPPKDAALAAAASPAGPAQNGDADNRPTHPSAAASPGQHPINAGKPPLGARGFEATFAAPAIAGSSLI